MYKMKSDINFSLTHEMLENAENERIHTSYAQEKAILECVSNGDIHALENTYYSLPTTVYGKMTSSNSKLKLLFYASIANTTLVTRYAIEGGLNEETAFSLSDVYIRKMEQCTDVDALMKLNEQMAIEFTLRVAEAKKTPKNYYSLHIVSSNFPSKSFIHWLITTTVPTNSSTSFLNRIKVEF